MKIITECAAAGLPEPEYDYQEPDFPVTLFAKTPAKTPVKTPVKTPELILALLEKNSSLSIIELADEIGKDRRTIERALKKLQEDDKLERIGPANGGSCNVLAGSLSA